MLPRKSRNSVLVNSSSHTGCSAPITYPYDMRSHTTASDIRKFVAWDAWYRVLLLYLALDDADDSSVGKRSARGKLGPRSRVFDELVFVVYHGQTKRQ